ncbi:hypothetical protein B0O80DRAFT_518966 [Mortierella sp. GBAus27b]|nr:hypothetical protein B0O80DRAFT_518966 [Mortierella sp. GBAus27b]
MVWSPLILQPHSLLQLPYTVSHPRMTSEFSPSCSIRIWSSRLSEAASCSWWFLIGGMCELNEKKQLVRVSILARPMSHVLRADGHICCSLELPFRGHLIFPPPPQGSHPHAVPE